MWGNVGCTLKDVIASKGGKSFSQRTRRQKNGKSCTYVAVATQDAYDFMRLTIVDKNSLVLGAYEERLVWSCGRKSPSDVRHVAVVFFDVAGTRYGSFEGLRLNEHLTMNTASNGPSVDCQHGMPKTQIELLG